MCHTHNGISPKRIVNQLWRSWLTKHNSPKIIPTSSCWLGSSTKESHLSYSTTIILLPRTKVRDHHRYEPHSTKIVSGEFIIKEINNLTDQAGNQENTKPDFNFQQHTSLTGHHLTWKKQNNKKKTLSRL